MPPKDTRSPNPKIKYAVGGIAEQNVGNDRAGRPYPTVNYAFGGVAQQNVGMSRPRPTISCAPGGVGVAQGSSVKIVTNHFTSDGAERPTVPKEPDAKAPRRRRRTGATFNNVIGNITGDVAILDGVDATITNIFGTGETSSSVTVDRDSISITRKFP